MNHFSRNLSRDMTKVGYSHASVDISQEKKKFWPTSLGDTFQIVETRKQPMVKTDWGGCLEKQTIRPVAKWCCTYFKNLGPRQFTSCNETGGSWNNYFGRRWKISTFLCRPLPPYTPTLRKRDAAYDYLDNSERLLYLTRCHSLLRPWWMGSESSKR